MTNVFSLMACTVFTLIAGLVNSAKNVTGSLTIAVFALTRLTPETGYDGFTNLSQTRVLEDFIGVQQYTFF